MCDDMSEGEYQYQMALCDDAGKPEPREHRGCTRMVWVTKQGHRIQVRKMSDQHIVNTVRMLRRWAVVAKPAMELEMLLAADTMNGEMAMLAVEEDAERLAEMDNEEFLSEEIPTYDALVEEALKRKLEL